MPDFYLSPQGHDGGSGTLADPWLTLAKGIGAPAGSTLHLLPGNYAAPASGIARAGLTIAATAPGVTVEPAFARNGGWTQVTLSGFPVWKQTATVGVNAKAACWATARNATVHRIPLWGAQPVVSSTPEQWANTVLNTNNPHCRWGMYAASDALYLIPPADGSWTDPNTVWIWASAANGIVVSANHVHLDGLTLICHVGAIKVNPCQRLVVSDCTSRVNKYGIWIFAGLPAVYGSDHIITMRWEDDLTSLRPGETQPPHQMMSWNEIKHIPLAYGTGTGSGLLNTGEACGGYLEGGATNVLFEDCSSDGTFDGMGHFMVDGRYDQHANSGLVIRRFKAMNGADDGIDFSRFGENVTVEDSEFGHMGTVASNAPFYGTMTYRRCQAWNIGDQSRVVDGFGHRPPGLLYKYGNSTVQGVPQGSVSFEDCLFWSDNPTTKGVSPDGGDGPVVPRFASLRSTWRVGSRAVNYLHPRQDFVDTDNTWSTSTTTTTPVTASFPVVLTPPAIVDARYYRPSEGDFEPMSVISDLQDQNVALQAQLTASEALNASQAALSERSLATASAALATAEAALVTLETLIRSRKSAQAAEDAAVA